MFNLQNPMIEISFINTLIYHYYPFMIWLAVYVQLVIISDFFIFRYSCHFANSSRTMPAATEALQTANARSHRIAEHTQKKMPLYGKHFWCTLSEPLVNLLIHHNQSTDWVFLSQSFWPHI